MKRSVIRLLSRTVSWMLGDSVRSALLTRLIHWSFRYMSFAIPVRRLRETPSLIAFFHPNPVYPLHILLVPKRSISTFQDVKPSDMVLIQDLVQAAQSLIQEYNLETQGYRLILNGGPDQVVPHLHVHLVSDHNPFVS